MWLHKTDPSFKRIASCYKRLKHFAKEGKIKNKNHPLACKVDNCLLFNVGWPEAYSYTERLFWLDWFADSLNRYMDENRIDGDVDARAILHNCLQYDFDLYDWELLVKAYENPNKKVVADSFEPIPTNSLKEQFNLYQGKFDDITTAIDVQVGIIKRTTKPEKKTEWIGDVWVRIDGKSTWKSIMKEFNKKAQEKLKCL